MKHSTITEGKVTLVIPKLSDVPSRGMPVFYNPIMKENRDIAVALVSAWLKNRKKPACIALPLAGTGIRAIRFAKEIPKKHIKCICINDYSAEAIKLVKKNLKKNAVTNCIQTSTKDANIFLLESCGFDYIDIDPFGSPNPFLDASIKRLSRDSILAVTATDTAPLCGTYIKACKRKYNATPLRCPMMHEIGLRILIRKVQIAGLQYDRALSPILSYSKDHYFRLYLLNHKNKTHCEAIHGLHGFIKYCTECQFHESTHSNTAEPCPNCKTELSIVGPLFIGRLFYEFFIDSMNVESKTLETIKEEMHIPTLGYYHIPSITKHLGKPSAPYEKLFEKIKKKGYSVSRTHFNAEAIKTNMPIKELEKLF
jgi:tRNA (guanine26-N2/guanine27-N2)-dimethyltransferase